VVFSYACPKRWTDLNAAGHVDTGVLIDYMQEARIELLLSQPEPAASMLTNGVLVTSHQVEYVAPIPPGPGHIDLRLWIDHIGGAAFSVSYTLSNAGLCVARARTQVAAYDLQAERLRRLKPAEREQLGTQLAPAEPIEKLPPVRTAELRSGRRYPCRVRWADLDSYGHVNNVRFFDYFSQARQTMLARGALLRADERWVVARQDLDYRLPIDFRREPYLIRTAATRIGSTSVELAADIVDDDSGDPESASRYSSARTVLVLTDRTGRPKPISPQHRDRLGMLMVHQRMQPAQCRR
jgi:acyl-CoA thioester hydrolase